MEENIIRIITEILKKNDAIKVSIFGSFARGEEREESDIDLLVEFASKKSLLDVIRIERELTESLNRKVEIVTEKAISPYMISSIKNEMVTIYG